MRVLLDTHAFLWWIQDDSRLSARAREVFASTANELVLSVASVWEMAVKFNSGKLRLQGELAQLVVDEMTANRIAELPVSLAHAFQVAKLPRHHGDPFDRILVAQAVVERLPILTADQIVKRYGAPTIW